MCIKRNMILSWIFLLGFNFAFGQPDWKEKYGEIKTWEVNESPTDLGFRHVPGWLKIPDNIKCTVPSAIAIDSEERIYILDRGDSIPSLICVNNNGEFLFQKLLKGFVSPHYLFQDKSGYWWISDTGTHQVNKINDEGQIIFSLGEKGESGWNETHFNKPTDIDFLSDGKCLISDGYGNQRVALFDSVFNYTGEWGEKGTEPGSFVLPHAITIGSDAKIYVSDRDGWRVQVFDSNGDVLAVWPHIGKIYDIIEAEDHSFFCLDGITGRITKVTNKGEVIGFFGSHNLLEKAHGFAMTAKGDIIVATTAGKVVMYKKKNHE